MPRRRKFLWTRSRKLFYTVYLGSLVIAATISGLEISSQNKSIIYFGLFSVFAILSFYLVLQEGQQRGRRARGCCVICGYDLRATPWHCPECGAIPGPSKRPIQLVLSIPSNLLATYIPPMPSPQAVIFDMDGVLVDSYSAHYQSWKTSAARFGLTITQSDFAATFGRTSRDIIRHLWPNRFDNAQLAAFDANKESDYRDILRAHLPVMPGADDLIAALHSAGFALAIGSSGPKENVAVVLNGLKHGSFFTQTVNGSEVTHGKPDPQVFLLAAQKLGIAPKNCAVIEDAPAGVEAARRAGMFSIGLLGTAPSEALAKHAHVIVAHLKELNPPQIAQWIDQNKN